MFNGQLEMSFGDNGRGISGARRQRQLNRARWWFQCMRQVVDHATEWQPQEAGIAVRQQQIELAPEFPG